MTDNEQFTDTANTEVNEGDFVIDLTQGLELQIKFAGIALIRDNFTGKKEKVEIDDHIKFSQAGFNLKMTPFQTACLYKALQDADNKPTIDKRFNESKKELSGVGF